MIRKRMGREIRSSQKARVLASGAGEAEEGRSGTALFLFRTGRSFFAGFTGLSRALAFAFIRFGRLRRFRLDFGLVGEAVSARDDHRVAGRDTFRDLG